jgi:regulator of protease activity HflC (stomatin/prohibitin superfamily)
MKKSLIYLTLFVAVISMTSCYDFYREQQIKDADANGKSILIEAENSKKAIIEQARAENEAAELEAKSRVIRATAEADAEIARARGVAEANRIIGESLRGNKEYLEYLKIDAIRNTEGTKIYIPTEAMIPITEAK